MSPHSLLYRPRLILRGVLSEHSMFAEHDVHDTTAVPFIFRRPGCYFHLGVCAIVHLVGSQRDFSSDLFLVVNSTHRSTRRLQKAQWRARGLRGISCCPRGYIWLSAAGLPVFSQGARYFPKSYIYE